MGGRGQSSFSGNYGLPNGARAVSVTFPSGMTQTYFKQNGMTMRADAIGTTHGAPVGKKATSIETIYANAVDKGYKVELLSASQVEANNASYKAGRKSNAKAIAAAEGSGTSQTKKISKLSGRIRASRK